MDTIENIFSNSENFSIWGIYKSISRFKKSIEGKYILQNVKGKGYILKEIRNE